MRFLSFLKGRSGTRSEGPAQALPPPQRAPELQALTSVSVALSRCEDPRSVGHVLVDEVRTRFRADFVGLAVLSDDGRTADGLLAKDENGEVEWWPEIQLDLRREPSGIASAAFEAAPFAVYDADGSTNLNADLVARVRAKSAAFVPLVSRGRVTAVLVAAAVHARRAFVSDELALMHAVAGEAALALDRTRSSSALADALARERLVAEIGRRVRSELDVDAVLRVAVEETGKALRVTRAFISLGQLGAEMPLAAEWDAPGTVPIGDVTRLPASKLAARDRRTVAIADVALAPELDDPSLGGRATLLQLNAQAVLATPILVFDRVIGVFALHRAEPRPWTTEEVGLAEAVAREAGLAIHTAQLLQEDRRRLEQHVALLQAARVVTAELRLETVLQRLVDEVAPLLRADAADCYLVDRARGTFRCAAVNGLPAELVGFEFPLGDGLAGEAVAARRPVISSEYGAVRRPVQHPAYESFHSVIVAPVTWSAETRGVLGVGVREPGRTLVEDDAMLLEAFANLASLALRNAESFEDRERQARIERGFYRIAAILGEPLSIRETIDAVAQAACDGLGGDSACVLMPTEQGLRPAGSWSLPDSLAAALDQHLLEAAPALSRSAADGRVLAASALAGDERFGAAWHDAAGACGYRSLLAIPVAAPRTEGGGLVVLFFEAEREVTDDDLELGGQLAQAARGALERAELFETERNARALSQQLAQSGTVVARELDPAAVIDETVERARAMLGADACVHWLLDADELVAAACAGLAAEHLVDTRLSPGSCPSGEVVSRGTPVSVSDASEDERTRSTDPLLAAGFHGYLGVPLATPESAGVVAVYSERPRAWRQEEMDALSALAGGAAAALANAELYQRVAQEKERSDAILANIADGIVAVDRDGEVVLWNDAAERITGIAAAEALGRTPLDLLHRRLESDGAVATGDRILTIRRGSEDVALSVTEAVMRDPVGAVSGRIFAFRDISGEAAVEQMKSDFVSAVSHELRTPLTSIYGFAETLLRADVTFGEEERRTFLGYIASEADRLTRIVDSLLNVARLDSGDLVVQLAPTDVRSVVAEAVAGVEIGDVANGHRIVVDLPEEEPFDATADRDKLRQVLSQLLDNAVKYSPEGGTVTISGRHGAGAVELQITDEGLGIPHGDQERIFTKFYRGEAATKGGRFGGTGLGLFIARGLVTAMGGRIWVDSTEGTGSTFGLAIPAAQPPVHDVEAERA